MTRNFEAFKEHVGMISEISPKSLPEIAQRGTQRRTKFTSFADAAWEVSTLERQGLIKQIIGERPMVLH